MPSNIKLSHVIKYATPAWIRQLAKGGLSSASIDKLISSVPQGKTRLVKAPGVNPKMLGAGGESLGVFESFTGGHGASATKMLSRKPSVTNANYVDELQNLFSSSDVFPAMLSRIAGGRGYTIPKLLPHPPKTNAVKELLSLPSSNKMQWQDFVKRFRAIAENPAVVNMNDAKAVGSFRAGGLPNSARVKTPKGVKLISDIKGEGNVMFNNKGRPFITDPTVL